MEMITICFLENLGYKGRLIGDEEMSRRLWFCFVFVYICLRERLIYIYLLI